MGTCYPLTVLPITRETFDATKNIVDTSSLTWLVFPDAVEDRMADILLPFGYDPSADDRPDAEHFLGQIEYMCRDESGRYPWAIIFFVTDYPLAGHLLSIRPSRDIRFANYSMFDPRRPVQDDSAGASAPPLSILFVFTMAALMIAAKTDSPLLQDAASLLADKPENESWVVIADPLDPTWVQQMASENDALFFQLI